jgi:hypothetical protein
MEFSDLTNNFKNINMKISKHYFLLLLVVFSACSDSNNNENEEVPVDLTAEIELNLNGEPLDVSSFKSAYRDVHSICVGAENNNSPLFISFDENGNFGKISYVYNEPLTNVQKRFTSYANFSSNYFNFNLISYDLAHKRVKVSFEGYIFYDPLNLNSESKYISGSFNFPMENYVPTIANTINEATINGSYWRSTCVYQKRNAGSGSYNNIALHTTSDDEYKIMIFFNDAVAGGSLPGIYNFSNSSPTNKVQIAKFNPITSTYTFYECTGIFSLDAKWPFCIQGTYNLTGVNPEDSSDTITIQNGKFKLAYKNN